MKAKDFASMHSLLIAQCLHDCRCTSLLLAMVIPMKLVRGCIIFVKFITCRCTAHLWAVITRQSRTHTHTHTAIFSPSNPYALKVALLSCLALDWRQGQQRSSGQHLSAPSCLVLLHILDFTTYVCVLHFRPWLGDCVSPCKPCSTNNPAFSRFVRGCSYYKTTPLV